MQGMMGESKKKMLRKKALESMMQGGPSIAVRIEKKMSAPEEAMMGKEGEEEMPMEGEKEGMESMMLSPEEKEMILMMRKKKQSMKSMGAEGEQEEME